MERTAKELVKLAIFNESIKLFELGCKVDNNSNQDGNIRKIYLAKILHDLKELYAAYCELDGSFGFIAGDFKSQLNGNIQTAEELWDI